MNQDQLSHIIQVSTEVNNAWSPVKEVRTWEGGLHGKIIGPPGSGKTQTATWLALMMRERARMLGEEFRVYDSGFLNEKAFPYKFDEGNMLDIIRDPDLPPKIMLADEFNTMVTVAYGQSHHTQKAKDIFGMARKTGTSIVGIHVTGQSALPLLDSIKRWEFVITRPWKTGWIAEGGGKKGSFCPAWRHHPTKPWTPERGTPPEIVEWEYLQHAGGPKDPKTGKRMGIFRSCLTFPNRFDINYYLRVRRSGTDEWYQEPGVLRCAQRLFPYSDTFAQQSSAFETQSRANQERNERDAHKQLMKAAWKTLSPAYHYSLAHMEDEMQRIWDDWYPTSGMQIDSGITKSLLRQYKTGNPDAVAKPKK